MALLDPVYIVTIFLVFVRIGGLLIAAPFFGHASIPVRVKIFFSVLMAYTLVGLVSEPIPPGTLQPVGMVIAIIIELLTGVSMGFAAQFIFWSVQYAAELLGFQMGLSMAQVLNPVDGTQTNPMGRFILMTMLVVFLVLDGHHAILQALVLSFEVIPLAGAHVEQTGPLLLQWTGQLFLTSLRLASPFMVTFFLVETSLGVFARVAPQTNLFILSMPIKLMLGLFLCYLFMENFMPLIPGFIDTLYRDMLRVIEVMLPR